MRWNPFAFLFETNDFPHARTARTNIEEKFRDAFGIFSGRFELCDTPSHTDYYEGHYAGQEILYRKPGTAYDEARYIATWLLSLPVVSFFTLLYILFGIKTHHKGETKGHLFDFVTPGVHLDNFTLGLFDLITLGIPLFLSRFLGFLVCEIQELEWHYRNEAVGILFSGLAWAARITFGLVNFSINILPRIILGSFAITLLSPIISIIALSSWLIFSPQHKKVYELPVEDSIQKVLNPSVVKTPEYRQHQNEAYQLELTDIECHLFSEKNMKPGIIYIHNVKRTSSEPNPPAHFSVLPKEGEKRLTGPINIEELHPPISAETLSQNKSKILTQLSRAGYIRTLHEDKIYLYGIYNSKISQLLKQTRDPDLLETREWIENDYLEARKNDSSLQSYDDFALIAVAFLNQAYEPLKECHRYGLIPKKLLKNDEDVREIYLKTQHFQVMKTGYFKQGKPLLKHQSELMEAEKINTDSFFTNFRSDLRELSIQSKIIKSDAAYYAEFTFPSGRNPFPYPNRPLEHLYCKIDDDNLPLLEEGVLAINYGNLTPVIKEKAKVDPDFVKYIKNLKRSQASSFFRSITEKEATITPSGPNLLSRYLWL